MTNADVSEINLGVMLRKSWIWVEKTQQSVNVLIRPGHSYLAG